MRLFVVLFAVLAVAAAAVVPNAGEPTQFASQRMSVEAANDDEELLPGHHTFYTRQDHSRPQVRVPVRFNYVANLEHFQEGGPFYIYLKDAFEVSNSQIHSGLMVDLAQSTNAALFTFDQRYFGNNNLTADTTFESLALLTIEQTLADIALFIGEIKSAHQGARSNVVLWGSGYGATLAAWARKRYPHLIDGVWSSSGTFNLEAFTFNQIDLLEYTILTTGSEVCRDQIKAAFEILNYLVENNEGTYIQERLRLCHPVDVNSVGDVGVLFESLVTAIFTYINRRHSVGIRELCTDMNRENADPLNSFAYWKNHVFGHDLQCFDYEYESVIERLSNTELTAANNEYGSRQWYYLTCTQLGLFAITDGASWLPNRLTPDYHSRKCEHIFGPEYINAELTPAIVHLISQFGSLSQRISNIIYTNGALDPWLHNGILFTRDLNAEAIQIPYAARSADLGSISNLDWASLRETKERVVELVREWGVFGN